jgi:hypothetical protein
VLGRFRDPNPFTPPTLTSLDDNWLVPGVWVVFLRDPGHFLVLSFDDNGTRLVIDNETKTAVPITEYTFKDAACTIVWRVDRGLLCEARAPETIVVG